MPTCDQCGKEYYKLATHAISKKQICIHCITEEGCARLKDDEIIFENDNRGSIRIPMTVNMMTYIGDDETTELQYPVLSVDISMTGICFTWDLCPTCKGMLGTEDSEHCIFYPYYINNPHKRELTMELNVGSNYQLKISGHVVHLQRDDMLDMEYIGVRYTYMSNHDRRVLEKIFIKYGVQMQG